MDYQPLSIRQALDRITEGQIRIPAFQRKFVWEMDRVAYLMDSIYKGFPFGSLLFWQTRSKLRIERELGPFDLPMPKADYPIYYVLDGQQRMTSIFAVFQTELTPKENDEWLDIYFDLQADSSAQETQFFALREEEVDPTRHFPLSTLFRSVEYRKATSAFNDNETLERLDELQQRFKEATIPVQVLNTEDRTQVAIVFERVNRMGVKLDTLQLLAAWTWNEDFDLLDRFKDLGEELAEFGFAGVGEDSDLILRCCAAVLKGDPSPETLMNLSGETMREGFDKVENGIKGAIDFLRGEVSVQYLKNLPYPALLLPLAVFFAEPDGKSVTYSSATLQRIRRWFWRSCFTERYSSQTLKTASADISEMIRLKNGSSNGLGDFNVTIDADFFAQNQFRLASAKTKTFILMLSEKGPKSFISGANVDLAKVLQQYNRAEFHHIFPRSYLAEIGVSDQKINSLCNFCFINSIENKVIGKKKPSVYRGKMPSDPEVLKAVLSKALCDFDMFNDEFEAFSKRRSGKLLRDAQRLMEIGIPEEVGKCGGGVDVPPS